MSTELVGRVVKGDVVKCIRGMGPEQQTVYAPIVGRTYRVLRTWEDSRGFHVEVVEDGVDVQRRFLIDSSALELLKPKLSQDKPK